MKCPQCGREIKDNETFCPGCGWRVVRDDKPDPNNTNGDAPQYRAPQNPFAQPKKERSKAGRVIFAVVSVLLYISLLFGCQSCVMSGYMTSLMMEEGVAAELTQEAALAQAERLIEATNEKIVLILLIANLTTILVICMLFHLRRKSPAKEMGLHFVNPLRFVTFAAFGTALNIFVSVTLSILPLPESVLEAFDTQYAGMYGNAPLIVEIFSVAVVAAIAEELVFRGIGMTRLTPVLGRVGAVVVSAVLFGLSHGTPIAVGYAVVLGIIFGFLYARFDSVYPTIVCHVFFNLTSYWLGEVTGDNVMLTLGLYVISIALILWCAYRMFIRYPTFNDMLADRDGRIPPINEEERAIMARMRKIQSGEESMDVEKVEDLERKWEENRKNYKENKK